MTVMKCAVAVSALMAIVLVHGRKNAPFTTMRSTPGLKSRGLVVKKQPFWKLLLSVIA
jgi:hypothetical protein